MATKRGLKRFFISLVVITLVLGSLSSFLHSSFFQHQLLSLIERSTHWKISFEDYQMNLLRGILQLKNVKVEDPKGKTKIEIDHFLINLSALSAIRGKIIVTDLEINHPRVQLTGASDTEKPNFLESIQKFFNTFEKSFWLQNTILDHIVIKDFNLEDPQGESYLCRKAVLEISPNFLQQIKIMAHLEDISTSLAEMNHLDLQLNLQRNNIQLKKMELASSKVTLILEGNWSGDLEKGSMNLKGQVEVPKTLASPVFFSLESDLKKKMALIKKLEGHLDKAVLLGHGTFHLENKKYDLVFTAKYLALESIFQKLNSVVVSPAKGIAEVEGHAFGELPKLHAEAKATIHDLKHGPIYARQVSGTLLFTWPELDWDAFIGSQAHVTGGVLFKHFPGVEKIQGSLKTLEAKFDNASLEELLPTLNLGGLLTGDVHLEGAQMTSAQGTGHAHVTHGHYLIEPVESLTTQVTFRPGGQIIFHHTEVALPLLAPFQWPGEILIESEGDSIGFKGEPAAGFSFKGSYNKELDRFRIDSLRFAQGENNLSLTLSVITNSSKNSLIEAKTKGLINMEWVRYFPAFFREGRGSAFIDLSCNGSVKDPLFKGHIDFKGNDLTLRQIPEEFSNIKGSLSVDGTTLIPHLSGQWADGDFQLKGRMKLDHGKPSDFDLALNGSNLTLSQNNVYRVDFDTNVILNGSWPSPLLEGRVDIIDGRYIKNFQVHDLVLKPFQESSENPPWEKSVENVRLNLSIKNSGDLKVQNNVASLFLQSNLQVAGTYGAPKISGALSATEGTFHYLGSDFVLNEGLVEFSDTLHREPYLTLSAQQEIPPNQPRYTVFVELKGYLSNLEISLSSTPSLSREDIVSLIAFGLTQQEIRDSSQSKRSLTSGLLGEEISSTFGNPVAKTTKLDIFRLEASDAGYLSRLSLGKFITDRLSLEFTNDLDPQTAAKTFQANYYLTDNILLKGVRRSTIVTLPQYQFDVSFRFRLH